MKTSSLKPLTCLVFLLTVLPFISVFAQETDPASVPAAETISGSPAAEGTMAPEDVTQSAQLLKPSAKVVKGIDVVGNKSIGVATILSKIKTRVGQEYIENVISDDLKRLYNTGYFSDVKVDKKDVDGGYKVIINLVEKPIVEEITFSKLRHFNKRSLESKMKTKKGKFLDNKSLKDDVNTIEEMYAKKGLTQAKVDVETFNDEATNRASLHFIVREGYRVKVKAINVVGNIAYSDRKIIKVIKSRPAWIFNSGHLKEDILEEDMDRIKAFYEQNGYIDAKATYTLDYLNQGRVVINITIEEGKRYYVGDLTITGNSIASEQEVRAAMTSIKPGNIFSRAKLEDDVNAIQTMYFDMGHIFAKVSESTSLNTDNGRVDVRLDIQEGGIAYIDKIKVQGNTNTRDIVIRRELRMYPGDQFDGKKLRRSKERLRNLGYFEDVGFDIEDTKNPEMKNLIVQVKEAKTGSFSFGGGYSTVDQLVGFVEIEQKNFDITNWPRFTGGGQDLLLRAEAGSTRRNLQLSFTEPWLFDYPISGGFDLFSLQRDKSRDIGYAYDEKRLGATLRLGKQISEYMSAGLSYTIQNIDISNLDSNVSADLAAEEGENLVSSLGFTLNQDYTDSVFNPTKGWVWNNGADLAGGLLGGDKNFYRLQTKGSYYIPVKVRATQTVLEVRGRAGIVQAYGDSDRVPIFERFFAGGAKSIRGYNERKVGPIDPSTEDPIGGESLLVGNIEYTFPIIDIIKVAAFYDVGNVWPEVSDIGNGDFKSGMGLGLRVKTPIGPVNLDYGYPLNDEPGEDSRSGKFYFSVSRGF
jgi:outer membrane protein insertion porin family